MGVTWYPFIYFVFHAALDCLSFTFASPSSQNYNAHHKEQASHSSWPLRTYPKKIIRKNNQTIQTGLQLQT
jgi:hypothetical protein